MNEQDTLRMLRDRIAEVCDRHDLAAEIILIDDGSTDESWDRMVGLAGENDSQADGRSQVVAIRLRRNFGKAAAMAAGVATASTSIVITMDADLQDDPEEIPRFIEKLEEGFDVVSGWKRVRHDPWHKVLPSRVFNALVSWLTGVRLHDHNCGFKAYRRGVFEEVRLYGERHRFVPVLAAARGFSTAEIEVRHHARQFGQSKYGVRRIIKGFLDLGTVYLLTSYSTRPLHLIGGAGLLCFAAGGIGIATLSAQWILSRLLANWEVVHLHQTAIFYYCILAILLGAQFLLAGLLGELIVSRRGDDPQVFSIAEVSRGKGCVDE